MNSQKRYLLLLVSLLTVVSTSSLYAHNSELFDSESVPVCDSVADDPDADGNGWTPHLFGGHACEVTYETRPRPESFEYNGYTRDSPMSLNYWDPNVDFANREIECTNYSWNNELAEFEIENVFYITHQPLPDSEPRIGEYEIRLVVNNTETHVGTGIWQSTHGRYLSESYYVTPDQPIKMFADPWGEEIAFNDQTRGMRFWHGHLQLQGDAVVIDGRRVQECKYNSGGDFLPTGDQEQPPTDSGIITIHVPQVEIELIPVKPEIVNPETSQLVDLLPLSWNPGEDLFHKKIWCTDYSWNTDSFDSTYPEADGYLFMPPQPGEIRGNVYVDARGQGVLSSYEWSVENGRFTTTSLFPTEGWYEAVSSAKEDIRVWTEDAYDSCTTDREYTDQKLIPTGEVREQDAEDQTPQVQPEETEQPGAVDTGQTAGSPEDKSTPIGPSNGGGSLSLFLLVLLAGGYRGKLFSATLRRFRADAPW